MNEYYHKQINKKIKSPQVFEDHSSTQRSQLYNNRGIIIEEKIKSRSWNVCSVKDKTYQEIKKEGCMFIRDQRQDFLKQSIIQLLLKIWEIKPLSFGGINDSLSCNDITDKLNVFDKEIDGIMVNVKNQCCNVVIINLYFNKEQIYQQNKKKLDNLLNELIYSKTDEVLVFPKIDYQKQIYIDYQKQIYFTKVSDHCENCVELMIKGYVYKKQHVTLYKIGKAYNLNVRASGQQTLEGYFEFVRRNLRKEQVIFRQRVKILNLNYKTQKLEQVLNKVAEAFCEERQKAYKIIRQLKNLNPQKKEGGIFKYFYDDEGEFCCDRVTQNCLDQLSKLSNRAPFLPQELPKLNKLPQTELQKLQGFMSQNKAISCDGISNTFLKRTKQYHLIENLWTNEAPRINSKLGEARLVL